MNPAVGIRLVGAQLVALGLQLLVRSGSSGETLLLLSVAGAGVVLVVRSGDRMGATPRRLTVVSALLITLQAIDAAGWVVSRLDGHGAGTFVALTGVAAALAAALTILFGRVEPSRSIQLVLSGTVLAVAIPGVLANPAPGIDVWVFHEVAAESLLNGENPYDATYPNIYSPADSVRYYAPEAYDGDELTFGFPYMPVVALAAGIGDFVFGDFRVMWALLLAATVWMICGSATRPAALVAGASLALAPIGEIVVLGWNEPLVVFLLCLSVSGISRTRRWAAAALGLFFAAKQYLAVVVPLAWLVIQNGAWRHVARRVAAVLWLPILVTLPLAVASLERFWFSVVELQLAQPFRPDAKSLLVVASDLWGTVPAALTVVLPLGAAVGALVYSLRRFAGNGTGLAAGVTVVMFAWLVLSKQSFLNHYLVVIVAALITVAGMAEAGSAAHHEKAPVS